MCSCASAFHCSLCCSFGIFDFMIDKPLGRYPSRSFHALMLLALGKACWQSQSVSSQKDPLESGGSQPLLLKARLHQSPDPGGRDRNTRAGRPR